MKMKTSPTKIFIENSSKKKILKIKAGTAETGEISFLLKLKQLEGKSFSL